MADSRFEQGRAGTGSRPAAGPDTATVLARWRKRAGVSRQRLADLSDVSATYVRTIEAGVDDQGREVVPSAAIMQKLARGLAQATAAEAQAAGAELEHRIYAELMAAAGYLPPAPAHQTSGAPPASEGASSAAANVTPAADGPASPAHRVSEAGTDGRGEQGQRRYGRPVQMIALDEPYPGRSVTLTLRDPRLREHLQPLLERWETLSSDDQALLLGIMAWVHERYQSSQDRHSGGR